MTHRSTAGPTSIPSASSSTKLWAFPRSGTPEVDSSAADGLRALIAAPEGAGDSAATECGGAQGSRGIGRGDRALPGARPGRPLRPGCRACAGPPGGRRQRAATFYTRTRAGQDATAGRGETEACSRRPWEC